MDIRESPLQILITEKMDEIFSKHESEITKSDLILLSHLADASLHIDMEVIEGEQEELPGKCEVPDTEFVIIARDKIRCGIELSDADLKRYIEARMRLRRQ